MKKIVEYNKERQWFTIIDPKASESQLRGMMGRAMNTVTIDIEYLTDLIKQLQEIEV